MQDTIVAPATAPGVGAIAVIRLSGPEALTLSGQIFRGRDLTAAPSHTAHFGTLYDGDTLLDEVVATVFRAPRSFTREDVVEFSCHGSPYVVQRIVRALAQRGARLAQPGEFTRRAFLNGRFDLAQAEAVADLIAADSAAAHQVALQQMRGGFSRDLQALRAQLVQFASLIELELDFSEEDVAFADRAALGQLVGAIAHRVAELLRSFSLGNALKNGVPTVIVGKPNAGKSTLLNRLLNEEKAIVSDIPGTTRDVIEDEIVVGGVRFRFVDTAGLREATDQIEALGIARTRARMQQAAVLLYVFDLPATTPAQLQADLALLADVRVPYLLVANKDDLATPDHRAGFAHFDDLLRVSAEVGTGVEALQERLLGLVATDRSDTVVTNLRHYESLRHTQEALARVREALDAQVPGDLLAQDIRQALFHLGQITGEVTTDELLGNIFSKFCIGK